MNKTIQKDRINVALFLSHVRKTETCWYWTASTGKRKNGNPSYGNFFVGGKCRRAHRVAYTLFVAPIPKGMNICHRCDVERCVRPSHLFAATQSENALDMWRKGRHPNIHGAKTHCPKGHPYDEQNTFMFRQNRRCRECHRIRAREDYWKQREVENDRPR